MAGRDRWRLLVVLLALASLGTMMVDYAAREPQQGPSPSALAADYERHVGERISFWATVVAVGDGTFTVRVEGGRLTVVGSDVAVEPGDSVDVYGTLRSNRRLAAERVLVSRTENRLYMFAVSVAAVGLALAAFRRHWRLDRRRLAFVPRDRTPAGADPDDEPAETTTGEVTADP
ncbi:MAG: hypothetical protein ABEH78_02135 [Haloferacaceae archaeon]